MREKLRSGYTTGACAAAAACGAAEMLAGQINVEEVTIVLPTGHSARFRLHGQSFSPQEASCFVVKDAGDDPDVTNACEVHARISRSEQREIIVQGGIGVGRITKPGLAVPPGEWAINPVPRRMIAEAVRAIFPDGGAQVTISIPDGAERAKKTLNARLGIIGGLSILGTTGIVRPVSAKAWTDTIDAALDVARACGCWTVVLSTGRTSELAALAYMEARRGGGSETGAGTPGDSGRLPEEAFIMMGDHLAHALKACASRGFMQPVIACQFAKLLKIACGYPNTHAAASRLDLEVLLGWAEAAHIQDEIRSIIARANTAREIAMECGFDPLLMQIVSNRARQAAESHAPGVVPVVLLCGYDGRVIQCTMPEDGVMP